VGEAVPAMTHTSQPPLLPAHTKPTHDSTTHPTPTSTTIPQHNRTVLLCIEVGHHLASGHVAARVGQLLAILRSSGELAVGHVGLDVGLSEPWADREDDGELTQSVTGDHHR